jgi:hypothetical protein
MKISREKSGWYVEGMQEGVHDLSREYEDSVLPYHCPFKNDKIHGKLKYRDGSILNNYMHHTFGHQLHVLNEGSILETRSGRTLNGIQYVPEK